MADTTNKPKLQLRSGVATSSDKTPSPATKLLINHGKPNFTIQKSPKAQENGAGNPLSPLVQNNNNNNYNAFKSASSNTNGTSSTLLKSTKFNGVFNASSVTISEKQTHQKIVTSSTTENEASKVVLRRTVREVEPELKDGEDESVPEFIRRQRRIQERLAKENVLDFENRRSGYFTHVVISPTATTSRTSFVETMASPAIVPSLEIPPPSKKLDETVEEEEEAVVPQATNGIAAHDAHIGEEEEEVARAIEEVNKAVAGEEDEHTTTTTTTTSTSTTTEVVHAVAVTTLAYVEDEPVVEAAIPEAEVTISHTNNAAVLQHASGALIVNGDDGKEFEGTDIVQVVHASPAIAVLKNGTDVSSLHATEHVSGALVCNADDDGDVVQHTSGALAFNGAVGESEVHPVTVQVVHAAESKPVELQNGTDVSSIQAATHASGALIVNDVSDADADAELEAMAKLKFEIKTEGAENVEVTPVLRTE